jgi:hypothetical protein
MAAKESNMLWTVAAILLVMWMLGMLSGHTMSGSLHLLLAIAVVVVVFRLITGRRVV